MQSSVFICDMRNVHNLLQYIASKKDVPKTTLKTIIRGQTYSECLVLEEFDVVARIINKEWWNLQNVVLNSEGVYTYDELTLHRKEINQCFKAIIKCISLYSCISTKTKYIKALKDKLTPCMSLILNPKNVSELSHKFRASAIINKKSPIFHYFHALLELMFHKIIMNSQFDEKTPLLRSLRETMEILLIFGRNCYNEKHESAFICNCVKNFWHFILFVFENKLRGNNFWLMFNESVEEATDYDFILWMLNDVACLQQENMDEDATTRRITPNFGCLEKSLQNCLKMRLPSLMPVLRSIHPLICNLWLPHGRIEVYLILWQYFGRRLNTSCRKNLDLTATDIVALLSDLHNSEIDFESFIGMLVIHLKTHPHHWPKIEERILSELRPNQTRELNKIGVFQVLLMCSVLTQISHQEMLDKFVDFVTDVCSEKRHTSLVFSHYLALMMREIKNKTSIECLANNFANMLEEVLVVEKNFEIVTSFVQELSTIVHLSENQQLYQWLLLNSWIDKYSQKCHLQDLKILMEILLEIFTTTEQQQSFPEWNTQFSTHVYGCLKHLCQSRTVLPESIGVLAAKIATNSQHLLEEAFQFFNQDEISLDVSQSFLVTILQDNLIFAHHQETPAMQTWVRVCLLSKNKSVELTKNMLKSNIFPEFISEELNNTSDPLNAFVEHFSQNSDQYIKDKDTTKIKFCSCAFERTHVFLGHYLSHPDDETTVTHIFNTIAHIFNKIGAILYHRNKVQCPYVDLVKAILLPRDVLTERPLHIHIVNAIKSTWILFYESLVTLNTSGDAFIENTLKDLVVKYVPHFQVVESPMLRALDDVRLADVILRKMSAAFFDHSTKAPDVSKSRCFQIIDTFVKRTTSVMGLQQVVRNTLGGCLECVLISPNLHHRCLALTLVKSITGHPIYRPLVKSEFHDMFFKVMDKHLAFNTKNFFDMLELLKKSIPSDDLRGFLPMLKKHVKVVESKRGVGFDVTLRNPLDKFEASL